MTVYVLIFLFVAYKLYKVITGWVTNEYCRKTEIDWGKVNEDRIMNDLNDRQIDANIRSGKYNKTKCR